MLSLLIKCYLQPRPPRLMPETQECGSRGAGLATATGDGGPGGTLFSVKRSADTLLPNQVHSHVHIDTVCVSAELKDGQRQRSVVGGVQSIFLSLSAPLWFTEGLLCATCAVRAGDTP